MQRSRVLVPGHVLSGPEGELGHTWFQGRHLPREVVGGSFRCNHQGLASLRQGFPGLVQGRSVQSTSVDSDAAAALQ